MCLSKSQIKLLKKLGKKDKRVRQEFIRLFLKKGTWYECGTNGLLYYLGDDVIKHVGFTNSVHSWWSTSLGIMFDIKRDQYTDDKVAMRLIQEAFRRYHIGDVVHFQDDLCSFEEKLTHNNFFYYNGVVSIKGRKGGDLILFQDGKWADVVPNRGIFI